MGRADAGPIRGESETYLEDLLRLFKKLKTFGEVLTKLEPKIGASQMTLAQAP